MPVNPTPSKQDIIYPTADGSYNISTFTSTVLGSADDYMLICEPSSFTRISAKSATAFTVDVDVQSPVITHAVRIFWFVSVARP